MPKAILIAGNAQRFADDIWDFRGYLTRDMGIWPKSIKTTHTAYLCEDILAFKLSRAIAEKTKEPLLILYCGHGLQVGWAMDDVRTLGYSQLAEMLLVGKRPVMIVSDCCHAMAAVTSFESKSVSPERVTLIGATEAGETTPGGLAALTVNSWRQNRPVRFGPELRWGAKSDHLFFPKKLATPP